MYPKKILLAEDDWDDQDFFRVFLHERKDVTLLSAVENGEELFNYLKSIIDDSALPDAIILDQNMPKRNGLQTLALLKQSTEYAHIPVMVYSTYADEVLIEQSTALGAALVWAKPLSMKGYHDMIDELFKFIQ